MSAGHDRAPMPGSTGATRDHNNRSKDTADVALFADGADVVIAGPRRGRPPIEVNAAIRGTSAVWDPDRKVWRLSADDVPAIVANLRGQGLRVANKVFPWSAPRDHRSPDPLPECIHCTTPYRRLGVVPRHCVKCGDRLELQVVSTVETVTARLYVACECGSAIEASCLFCGDCGAAVRHG